MRLIRIGICALLAFTVLAHGAVEGWSEGVLEIGAALLFVWWGVLFARGSLPALRWNWLLAPAAALWVLVVVQYLVGFTAVPFLTRVEIMKYSALAILLFLAVQAYETLEQWQGFVWFVLALGFAVSVLGILQYFTFNGKLYWFRELRYGGLPFGPYVNRNHFAGLVELIVPTGFALLVLRAERRDRMPLIAILTLLPIGALFLSASRGGIVGFFIEVGLVMVLAFIRRRGRNLVVAGAVVFIFAGALVGWLGIGPAFARFAAYQKFEVTEQRRAELAKETWHIFADHPLGGTGFGTFQAELPHYASAYHGDFVFHAHNDYLEALSETGLVGGIFYLTFLIVLLREGWRCTARAANVMDLAFHIGALAACCGLLAHSLVDFNLHIPSNALLFLLQAVIATSPTPFALAENANSLGYTANSAVEIGVDPV
jgi:O-antigen ligase